MCGADGEDGGGNGEEEEEVVRVEEEEAKGEQVERVKVENDERRVSALVDPRTPTEKEVKEHMITHLPFGVKCALEPRVRMRIIGKWWIRRVG